MATGPAGILGEFLERANAGEIQDVVVAVRTVEGHFDYATTPMTSIEFLGFAAALQANAGIGMVFDAVDEDGPPAA